MSAPQKATRVAGKTLSNYIGQHVFIIVKANDAQQTGPNSFQVSATDGTRINLFLPVGEMLKGEYVQVVGKVFKPDSIEASFLTEVSPDFDIENYNEVLGLMQGPYREIFE